MTHHHQNGLVHHSGKMHEPGFHL